MSGLRASLYGPLCIAAGLLVCCAPPPPPPGAVWLSSLEARSGTAIVAGVEHAVRWSAIPAAEVGRADFAPLLGRMPRAVDEVVLSNALWTATFDGAPAVIGTPLELDGRTHLIVGVLPPGVTDDPPRLWAVTD